jgi:hypothetical protein
VLPQSCLILRVAGLFVDGVVAVPRHGSRRQGSYERVATFAACSVLVKWYGDTFRQRVLAWKFVVGVS